MRTSKGKLERLPKSNGGLKAEEKVPQMREMPMKRPGRGTNPPESNRARLMVEELERLRAT